MILRKSAFLLIFPIFAAGSPFFSTNIGTTCPTPSTVGAYAGITCDTGNENAWLEFSGFTNSSSADNFEQQALANTANEGFYYNESPGLTGPLMFQIGFNIQTFGIQAGSVTFHQTITSSPQGSANITMYVCNGPAISCLTNPLQVVTLGSTTAPSQTVTFAPTSSFGVLFVGDIDDASTLTQFQTTVGTVTDEPATPFLMGFGLLCLSLLLLRMRRANSVR